MVSPSALMVATAIVVFTITLCIAKGDFLMTISVISWFVLMLYASFVMTDKDAVKVFPVMLMTIPMVSLRNPYVTLALLTTSTIYMSDLAISSNLNTSAIASVYIAIVIVAIASESEWLLSLV